MNWGKSIILAFILFGAFIATLVTVCVQQDISLVAKDYYRDELVYQRQIDRMAHTAMLTEKPSIEKHSGNTIKISYADFAAVQEGQLQLFRPSDPALDKAFDLHTTTEPALYISTAGMDKGLYRARLKWKMRGEEFFLEQVIEL